jgi:hypothetical protein
MTAPALPFARRDHAADYTSHPFGHPRPDISDTALEAFHNGRYAHLAADHVPGMPTDWEDCCVRAGLTAALAATNTADTWGYDFADMPATALERLVQPGPEQDPAVCVTNGDQQ